MYFNNYLIAPFDLKLSFDLGPRHNPGTYASPVILVIGVVGNVLSIAVMMEKGNRNNAFAVYLSALAVADTGSLLTWAYRLPGWWWWW